MNCPNQNQSTKLLNRKYIIAAVLLFLIIAAMVCIYFTQEQKSELVSEKVIREAAAEQLNKDLNKLTDEDLTIIKRLDLSGKKVYSIRLLRKFANLEELNLNDIPFPEPDIPKWMVFLGKMKVINLYQKYRERYREKSFIDLSPLENLSHLNILYIINTPLKDLKPLAKIENLQEINADSSLLTQYGLSKSGDSVYSFKDGDSVYVNGKEFILGIGINYSENLKESIPKIKLFLSLKNSTPIIDADIRLLNEVDKALKK